MKKKAVSIIVSYVLLILIAVAISTLVYSLLKIYVPKETLECKPGISILITEASCGIENKELSITLENTGLFKIDKAFIRIGMKERQVKDSLENSPFDLSEESPDSGLIPRKSKTLQDISLPSSIESAGDYILEIQPAYFTNKLSTDIAICPTISKEISCE